MGYRKKVIEHNITQSFPDKSYSEIQSEIRLFQQSFCDQWMEMIKLFSISPKKLNNRVECDWTLFHQYAQVDKSCVALLGHQFNWEMANFACQLATSQKFAGMYLPLKSKIFNRIILRLRSRLGSTLIDATKLRSDISKLRNETFVLGLLADQSPSNLHQSKWYRFLNQPCAFMLGPAKQARLLNTAVVFCETIKVSRGHYKIQLHEITDNARSMAEDAIIDKYVELLQKSIQNQPHNWLWSHKRWKHSPSKEEVIFDLPSN